MASIVQLRKRVVIAALRKASLWWSERSKVRSAARIERGKYKCAKCGKIFGHTEIQVDHIVPVVPYSGWKGYSSYINNLFCSASNLQVLCRTCHKKKTASEKLKRSTKK